MAEAALTWTLFLHRDMHLYREFQSKNEWRPLEYTPAARRTVGILGLGLLGSRCSELLVAQGFQVIGWSNNPKSLEGVTSYAGPDQLKTILKQSDVIINLLPSTPATHHLFNQETLDACSPGTKLINFGRGDVIDETSLLNALEQGTLEYAVLDVFDTEPLPKDHPFWQHPNITVLPHISAPTRPDTACQVVRDNLLKYRAEGTLPTTVDFKRGY
jgi:glyoxylate/hydroxypyruvate reductase A